MLNYKKGSWSVPCIYRDHQLLMFLQSIYSWKVVGIRNKMGVMMIMIIIMKMTMMIFLVPIMMMLMMMIRSVSIIQMGVMMMIYIL